MNLTKMRVLSRVRGRGIRALHTENTSVAIHEVSPRDGLQNESVVLSADEKLVFLESLSRAKPSSIEVTSFVRADRVPQLADADSVCERLRDAPWAKNARAEGIKFAGLVPNMHGYERFARSGLNTITCLVSATNGHSKANVGKTIAEALVEVEKLIQASKSDGIIVRGYVSMAFGCPIDGETDPVQVQDIVQAYADLGADAIILADTIGTGTPDMVHATCKAATATADPSKLGLHMHNTYGHAIENCVEGLKLGFHHFDGAVGGCGGCPFAPGAAGNLATSQLVKMMVDHNASHGMDQALLDSAVDLLEGQLQRPLER